MRTVIRGTAELAVTAGLVLALLVAHLVWGTGDYTRRQQSGLQDDLELQWSRDRARRVAAAGPAGAPAAAAPPASLTVGRAFAVIRIPRFGADYRYAVVEGVTDADLRKGPGHYPGTARPGAVGNMVVSGHRTTYGAPFNRVGELVTGDEILIDTAVQTYVYRVTGRAIVRPNATGVTAPVPGRPGRRPTKRLLTLTTCHPKYSAALRMIVYTELAGRRARG